MTYETDLKKIYNEFSKFAKNNLTIKESDFKQWLKYAYITGKQEKEV
jgi:hypothetical protein